MRTWERRYGIPCPGRTLGRQRLYTEDDIERIRAIGRLLERGWTVAGATSAVANSVGPPTEPEAQPAGQPPLAAGKLAQLLHEVADSVTVTDLDGNITFWNAGAERLFGWRADDVLGRPVVTIVYPPEKQEHAHAHLLRMAAERRFDSYERDLLRRDGSTFRGITTTSPLLDDDYTVSGIIGVTSDVTERESSRTLAQVRAAELESIAVLGVYVSQGAVPSKVIDDAVIAVRGVFGVNDVWVFTLEGEAFRLRSESLRTTQTLFEDSSSLLHYTKRTERPVISNDVRNERRFDPTSLIENHDAVSALSVPMHGPGGMIGVLACTSPTPRVFTPEDAHYLQSIGNIISACDGRPTLRSARPMTSGLPSG